MIKATIYLQCSNLFVIADIDLSNGGRIICEHAEILPLPNGYRYEYLSESKNGWRKARVVKEKENGTKAPVKD